MTMRVRTIIVSLVAAISLGAGTQAAQARPNDGRYQQSAEGMKKKYDCGFAKYYYGTELGSAQRQADKGYTASAVKHAQNAKDTRVEAKSNGCGWAA
jgi:hypothetical protein